jgi:hypothetical protein
VCSETSAIINQTPGNHPKEDILYSKHGESLKSRISKYAFPRAPAPLSDLKPSGTGIVCSRVVEAALSINLNPPFDFGTSDYDLTRLK